MADQDSVYCKIFDIVSLVDTCPNCSYKTDEEGCTNISKEWKFS